MILYGELLLSLSFTPLVVVVVDVVVAEADSAVARNEIHDHGDRRTIRFNKKPLFVIDIIGIILFLFFRSGRNCCLLWQCNDANKEKKKKEATDGWMNLESNLKNLNRWQKGCEV